MEPQKTPIKNIILILVTILLVTFASYLFFIKKTTPQVIFDQFGNPVEAQVVGQDLIDLLARLQSVELDGTLFQDKAFLNLTDYSLNIPDQLQGRDNPFDPITGRVAAPVKIR